MGLDIMVLISHTLRDSLAACTAAIEGGKMLSVEDEEREIERDGSFFFIKHPPIQLSSLP